MDDRLNKDSSSPNVKELWQQAWSQHGIGKIPETEYRFHPIRKFRFDFAWPDAKVAVETDGFGRHQTKKGFSTDHEKVNLAQEEDWIVFRFTARNLGSRAKREQCAKQVLRTIKRRRLECTMRKNGVSVDCATCTKRGTK